MNLNRWALSLTLLLSLVTSSHAHAWSGQVIAVTDGDTIKVLNDSNETVKVRLYGIDCPERRQAFGTKAKQFVSEMVFEKQVEVDEVTIDRYGRSIAHVVTERRNLSEALIQAGLAWVYTRYCKQPICASWAKSQADAEAGTVGLWVDPAPVPPWEFRRKR